MNILQICNKLPFSPKDGGALAMYNIWKGLNNLGVSVDVFALNPNHSEKPYENPKIKLTYVNIDTKVKIFPAFLNLFSKESYNVKRFYSKEADLLLEEKLKKQKFDFIILESLFVCPYINTIRKNSGAKIIFRAHNVEHLIWKKLALSNKNFFFKAYFSHLSKKLKHYELKIIRKVDGIAAITASDAQYFNSKTSVPVTTIPFGIDMEKYICKSGPEENSLFHLGSMDWRPNIEAVDWFLENCWLKIHKEFSSLKFYVAGKNLPEKYFNISLPNIIVVGEVKDAVDFICSKKIMIVPLLSGSGLRVKIIEGMACGKIILSTSMGAEGIEYTEGKDILIANSPEEFIVKLKLILNSTGLAETIGTNARQLTETCYSNSIVTKKLINFLNKI